MGIQVIDRRSAAMFMLSQPQEVVVPQSNLKSVKEVTEMKVRAIVVKNIPQQEVMVPMSKAKKMAEDAVVFTLKNAAQCNPNKEVKVKAEVFTRPQVEWLLKEEREKFAKEVAALRGEISRLTGKEIDRTPTRHQEVKKQVIRINAQSAPKVVEEEPVKVKADMHAAGVKAITTRMVKQVHANPQEVLRVFKGAKVGEVRRITVDRGLPTQKELRMKFKAQDGRLHQFALEVVTKYGNHYPVIAFQF